MKAKLVCAYAVGFALHQADYQILTPCDSATQTNCYVGWASFRGVIATKENCPISGMFV